MKLSVLVLYLSCLLPVIHGTWRFTISSGVSPLHFPTQSLIEKYYISGREMIILQSLNKSNINYSLINMGLSKQCLIKSANSLICPRYGKYEIEFERGNCTSCNATENEMIFRISETSYCYYWSVITSLVNSSQADFNAHVSILQISVSVLSNDSNEMDEKSFDHVNRMLHSRGEKPVLIDMLGRKLDNIQTFFNPMSSMWNVTLPHGQPDNSSYVLVAAERMTTVFGCGIAPTVILLNHPINSELGDDSRYVKLASSREIIGQPRYHPCAYERVVLPTADGIFYTSDDFVTVSMLRISASLATIYGTEVTHIDMTRNCLLIILQGELFVADIGDRNLLLKNLALLENLGGTLSGISSHPLCLINPNMTDIYTWESSSVLTWSASLLFIYNEINGNILERESWIELRLSEEYRELIIIKAKLENTPNQLWILARDRSVNRILQCEFRQQQDQFTCSSLDFSVRLSEGIYEWEFLNSAHLSAVLWTSTSIYYYFNDGVLEGTFQEITSVNSIAFSRDKTTYLIEANDRTLFYGSGKSINLVKLPRGDVNINDNYVHKFVHVGDEVIRVSWNNGTFKQEVYPLYKELYSVLQSSGDNNNFCDHANYYSARFNHIGNAVNLEHVGQEILVDLSFVHPASDDVEIRIFTFFRDLVVMKNMSTLTSAHVPPGRPLLRTQNFRGTLQGACTDSSSCTYGIAVLEIEVSATSGSPTCLFPTNEVLYINVTCPDGMHLRIRQGFTDVPEQCILPRDDPLLGFYLNDFDKTEVHSSDQLLYIATDDVMLTEINNATGFELVNRNLMLKDCFLCEKFHPLNASSIILQTALSACPCRTDRYDPALWMGNLSFTYVESPLVAEENLPWKHVLLFDVVLLSKSHCDLSTRLVLYLLRTPSITQDPLEILFLATFAFVTVAILLISYRIYINLHGQRKQHI